MDKQDEYIVYIEKIDNRFYYKNGKLHREAGPAVVPAKLKDKYINLVDQDLYVEKFKTYVNEPVYMFEFEFNVGTITKKRIRPNKESYYLEGVEYIKAEFDAIILDKQLPKNGKNIPKIKI